MGMLSGGNSRWIRVDLASGEVDDVGSGLSDWDGSLAASGMTRPGGWTEVHRFEAAAANH